MPRSLVDLSCACYGEVKDHKYELAILPWGATEPHNQHLPYMTDAILSHDIAVEAAEAALKKGSWAMVMPPVTFGAQNPGQRELSFCVHGRYETQCAILRDTIASLYHQGMRKMLIVNGHGGNSFKNMIRDVLVDWPDFMIASCEWFNLADGRDIFENGGEHAHELETSVMMYYHPDLVDLSIAGSGEARKPRFESLAKGLVWMPRNWSEISDDTGIGDPRKSSFEKGQAFSRRVVEVLTGIIEDYARY